jgi:parvulin-like peptidyl-prolyl isomerase
MSLTTMRRKFKRAEKPIQWLLVVIFVLGCFSLYGSYNSGFGARAQAEDLTIAKVNGQDISRDLYQRALEQNDQRARMSNPGTPVTPDQEIQMKAAAFEMALTDTLRTQIAQQQGVQASDREVRAMQKKLVDQIVSAKLGQGTPAADRQEFEEQARRQWFPEAVVRNQVLGQKLEQQLRSQTKPTEADLMKSFQEYKTRHILVKTDTRSEDEAKRLAGDVLNKIKAGVGFEDLARKYSEDPGSKGKGGDLGWVSQKTGFVPEFKEALLKLNKGEVSPLVKTTYGYHIIKVEDVRSTLPKDINKPGKKAQYLKEYTDQFVQDKFSGLMAKARKEADIKPVDPFVKGYLTESDMLEAQQKGNQPLANSKLAEAIKAYEDAAKSRYGGPAIYAKLAELYQQAKQDDKAVAALQLALGSRANATMAWQLGELLMKQKKTTEAVIAYQKAAEGAYDMPWMHPQLADRFRMLKRPDLAAKEQAKWAKWQKDNSKGSGGLVRLPTGEQVQMQHEQTPVSPEEAKKLQHGAKTATIPVTKVPAAK